jgi:hypothetical protein
MKRILFLLTILFIGVSKFILSQLDNCYKEFRITTPAKEGVYNWKIDFTLKSYDRRKQISGLVNLIK